MAQIERIKNDYREQVRQLLSGYHDTWLEFERRWGMQQYREAYLHVYEFVKKLGLKPSAEFCKADKEFYGGFIN